MGFYEAYTPCGCIVAGLSNSQIKTRCTRHADLCLRPMDNLDEALAQLAAHENLSARGFFVVLE